jgi:hypothetical protein
MPDTFVPLIPATTRPREAAFASMPLNGLAPGAAPSDSKTPQSGAGSAACSKPVVTLQRKGEIVSGIRIECGCGQVVELSCVY